ncbi:uncharacterized protein [Choristoneura fumiferana]|uniref:uncharacterized protein n=1 Tax=Choristoneura fumiferana TaxID=7141 RepID=UPI003D15E9BF
MYIQRLQDVTATKTLSVAYKQLRAALILGTKYANKNKLSLKSPLKAENSENEDEESDDVQELNDPEEPSDPQNSVEPSSPQQHELPSPIRGTEDDDGPDSEHCQEKPNHYHCKKGVHGVNGRDEDIMILKPASKKKLCLFNIHHEYCINQQSTG